MTSLVPPEYREGSRWTYGRNVRACALVMYCLDWSLKDISKVLNIPYQTVKMWTRSPGPSQLVDNFLDDMSWAEFRDRIKPLIAAGLMQKGGWRTKERSIGELALDADRALDSVLGRFFETVDDMKVTPGHVGEMIRVKTLIENHRQQERQMLADVQVAVAGIIRELVRDPALRREIAQRFEQQAGELAMKYAPLGEEMGAENPAYESSGVVAKAEGARGGGVVAAGA